MIKYSEIGKAEDKQKMKEAGISEAEMIKRGHHKLHYTTVLWEIRCKHNLSCMLTIIDYDEKGNILTSIHVPATESCSNLRPETSELYPLYYMMCDKQAGVK